MNSSQKYITAISPFTHWSIQSINDIRVMSRLSSIVNRHVLTLYKQDNQISLSQCKNCAGGNQIWNIGVETLKVQ